MAGRPPQRKGHFEVRAIQARPCRRWTAASSVPRLQRSLDNDVHDNSSLSHFSAMLSVNRHRHAIEQPMACVERAVKFDFHTGSLTTRCPTWNGARPRRWSWSSRGRSSYPCLVLLLDTTHVFAWSFRPFLPRIHHHFPHHHDRSFSESLGADLYSALDRLLSSLKKLVAVTSKSDLCRGEKMHNSLAVSRH